MATKTLTYTGSLQTFTVPAQCFAVTCDLRGGRGGDQASHSGSGGLPGRELFTITVTPGQLLYFNVGLDGNDPGGAVGAPNRYGGGGGSQTVSVGGASGCSGGGATDLRIGGTALSNRKAVAAGGGGASGSGAGTGGNGGGTTGATGHSDGTDSVVGGPGTAGTPSAGGTAGIAGTSGGAGTAGSSGAGGVGGTAGGGSAARGGGGGGGGYYGGGGGGGANGAGKGGGGGGGSSYLATTINGSAPTSVTHTQGTTLSSSHVYLTYNIVPVALPVSPLPPQDVYANVTNATFSWNYSDSPDDAQTAYQLIIENNLTGAAVYDSGKITSATHSRSVDVSNATTFPRNTQLRWKVRVYDILDTTGGYSTLSLFTIRTPPTFTLSPANAATLDTGSPTVDWSTSLDYHGTSQYAWSVVFRRISDGLIIHEAGGTGTQTSYTPVQSILTNIENYSITVVVTDTGRLSTTHVSNVDTVFVVPDSFDFTVDDTQLDTLGYVLIDWSSAVADADISSWRVYHKLTTDTNWTLLKDIPNVNTRTYHDWMIVKDDTYMYSVTQVANRFGSLVESPLGYDAAGLIVDTYPIFYENFWIIDIANETASVKLTNVVGFSIADEYEENTFTIIGRGRKKEYGTHLGVTGSLEAHLRGNNGTPRLIKAQLELLKLLADEYWIRTPLGDLFKVGLGNITYNAIAGVGTSAMYDVTIPFEEVS